LSDAGPELSELGDDSRAAIETLVGLLATDPAAPTAVTDPAEVRRVHVADSLSGLRFAELAEAARICDVGAGAGLPGLVLAAALPQTEVVLVDSVTRKCDFIRVAAESAGLENVTVIDERAESPAVVDAGPFDVVTARAVGRLSTLAELASPLLGDGGVLIAWKGRRDPAEEAELQRAGPQLAMEWAEVAWVGPYAGSENRHLHLIRKCGPTPAGLPRRAGMAKKRPRGRT
jgi:16S rRNA (guanine527-N7)-methyltransferase